MGRPKREFPELWKYPHDALKKAKALAWVRAKAQAKFRNEPWAITEFEWMEEIWTDKLWLRRGRKSNDLCLIRDDAKCAWSKDNVLMVTRRTQLVLQKNIPDMKEIEPGIWDIAGVSLEKWEKNQLGKLRIK